MSMSNARFCRLATYIAKAAASWAGDTLVLDGRLREPVPDDVAKRFIADIRQRLDFIEEEMRQGADAQ